MTKGYDKINRMFRKWRREIKQLPNNFATLLKGNSGKLGRKALAKITREPGHPIYPLRWQSERQRRAFFATKGFGRGIPYRRTGGLLEKWRVEVDDTTRGAIVALVNPTEAAKYVQGREVQKFHLDTGWVQVQDVADDFYREVGEEGGEFWFEACEETVQVPK